MPSPRALLIMLAIILLIVSPFVVFFLPLIYILTFFDTPEQIVAHPNTKNYIYAFSACAIIIVAIILAAIRQNKSMIALSVTLGLAGCALFFTSIFGYTSIGTDKIVVKEILKKTTLEWEDIHDIVLEYDEDGYETYTFTKNDKTAIQIPVTRQYQDGAKSEIYALATDYHIAFEERKGR